MKSSFSIGVALLLGLMSIDGVVLGLVSVVQDDVQ
jgi:hypothetical protein